VSWKAIACSAVGKRHLERQVPCQDYGQYAIAAGSTILGAVADGAGSAKHADVGAKLAVETALEKLKACATTAELPTTESSARQLFTTVVESVVIALQAQSIMGDYLLEDLACTLLIFIATPEQVAAMQIGDGFIVINAVPGSASPKNAAPAEYKLLFQPDRGEYINETCFVTSDYALEQMQVGLYSGQTQFVCASTDGLEKVAIRINDWQPFAPFFIPLVACLDAPLDEAKTYLQNFLESDRLNARTDDDKTLLLCRYDVQEEL
jgi:hypothetical protein